MGFIRARWISVAGDSLALAFVDRSDGIRQRRLAAYLMFALCGLSAAAIAFFEWGMTRADTPERSAQLLRGVHMPLALLTVALVLFVRLQFRASRHGWTMPLIAVSLAALTANFLTGVNLDFRILVAINAVLMTLFLIDTITAAHKHGDSDEREKVLPVCLSILAFVVLASVWEFLLADGLIVGPLFVAPPFLGISLVMAFLMGRGILHGSIERTAGNERFGLLIESMPCTVLLVNEQGSIRFANERAEAMFRYARAQLIGMRIESLMPAASRAAYAELRQAFARDPARATGAGIELSALRSDDSEVMVEISLTAVETSRERLSVVALTDISERKRVEREAALQRDELAHLSRTASLSALSSSLAHELVQPLTAILSNAQAGTRFLARQPSDIEAVRASLGNVVDNAKRASDVIRRLRSMLRKDAAEFVQLDINDVVRDIMQILRSDLIERRVDVVLDLKDDLPRTSGDRIQLQQVMLNLIMNAADAMSGDNHARRLTLRTLAAASGDLEVQVEDTGSGIAEADLDRIFTPFVTTKKGGMGLGLSVCAMLIQAHGGSLWATNNNAGGATLHVRLPRSAEDSNRGPASIVGSSRRCSP